MPIPVRIPVLIALLRPDLEGLRRAPDARMIDSDGPPRHPDLYFVFYNIMTPSHSYNPTGRTNFGT